MLYVINSVDSINKTIYTLFETNTESSFRWTDRILQKALAEKRINIKNAKLIKNQIKVSTWDDRIGYQSLYQSDEAGYIALCKINDRYKLVSYNGNVSYINTEGLYDYITNKKIHNCIFNNNGDLLFSKAYSVIKDIQFEEQIAEKYEKHVALTAMLGKKTAFEYNIEGKVVKLKRYIAQTKDPIIPNFITAIGRSAFGDSNIESVTIGNGVEYIGGYAFEACNISEIIIPQQVKFIGPSAFHGYKKLAHNDGEYTEKIKLLSKPLIIHRYLTE